MSKQMTELSEKDIEALLAKAEILWQEATNDCFKFIDEWVHIEDKDSPGIKVNFTLWNEQKDALQKMIDERLTICLKARQVGLTWLALAYAVWNMVRKPGYTASAISRSEKEGIELSRRVQFILRNLPPFFIQEKKNADTNWNGPVWEGGSLYVRIHHPKDQTSRFMAHASSPDTIRSLTDNLIIFDEWAFHQFAKEIWTGGYPVINRPTGGQVIGLSTGKRNTLFEEKWNEAVEGNSKFSPIFLPWYVDPRRTRKWYEETLAEMGPAGKREYPATPEEAFSVGEGQFFDKWDPNIHVPFGRDWYPPVGSGRIVGAYDGGYNRACFKWYWVSPDGWTVCYREYYPEKKTDPEQAEAIRAMSRDPDGGPEDIDYTIADTSCWVPNKDTGESTAQIFARHGIPLRQASKARELGWRRLHQYLAPFEDEYSSLIARLRFTSACSNTIRTYPMIETHAENPEDIASQQEDHCQDCDRYFAMSRTQPKPTPRESERRKLMYDKLAEPRSKITNY